MSLYNDVYQLLSENDCVIIPGFGGFVVNYFEADVDLRNQEFYPPSRRIAFNESLQNNDGLLMNYLCQKNSIDWNSAEKYVNQFAQEINAQLNNNQQLSFDNLGVFTKKSGKLVFSPEDEVNILNSSFGLSGFHFPMIKSTIEVQKPLIISKTKSAKTNKKQKSRKPILYIVSAAAVIIGLSFITIHYNLFDSFNNSDIQQANIIPVEVVSDTNATENEATTELIVEPEVEVEVAPEIIETEPVENIDVEVIENAEPVVDETPINTDFFVHIIAGSFANINNAQNLQMSLSTDGFHSQVLPIVNGMYRVSVKSFANKDDANQNLEQLRSQTGNSALWVLFW